MKVLFFLSFIALSCFAQNTPESLDWSPENRPSFRQRLLQQDVFLQPAEAHVDSSVGIRISGHNPEEFKNSLLLAIRDRGAQVLQNSKIYTLGVEMGKEAEIEAQFQNILNQEPFKNLNIKITVLSVPPKMILELSKEAALNVLRNMAYFFPSMKRDFQKPTWGEIQSGLVADGIIEVSTVSYLFANLPVLDASLTAISHATLIGAFVIFQKSFGNWITRPGSSNAAMFLKQSLTSVPFILSYNVFGNFTNITNFIKTNGYDAAMANIPHELANFTTTQGFTVFLQTLFYYTLMSKGIRTWVNRQEGSENARVARIMANYNSIPFLVADSIFLAMASTNHHPLHSIGYFDINVGHLSLIGLTAFSSIIAMKPHLLDPTIRWYKSYERLKERYFGRSSASLQCARYFR